MYSLHFYFSNLTKKVNHKLINFFDRIRRFLSSLILSFRRLLTRFSTFEEKSFVYVQFCSVGKVSLSKLNWGHLRKINLNDLKVNSALEGENNQ
jgi:hypothetical protein